MKRFGLAPESIEALMIEIGGREARIPLGQETPWAIVEAFARNVHIVCVQHAVDKAGHHPAGGEIGHTFDHQVHQAHRWIVAARSIVWRGRTGKLLEAIIDEPCHVLDFFQGKQALEGADADMTVAETGHDG